MYHQAIPSRFSVKILLAVAAVTLVFMLGLSVGESVRLHSVNQGWHANQHLPVYGRYGHFVR